VSSNGIPYVQYLLCEKTQFQHNTNPPVGIPQNVMTVFMTANCPTGWKLMPTTSGRLLVGLPKNGIPLAPFGGKPLSAGEDRTHTHQLSGSVSVTAAITAVGRGCCDNDWGGQGTYNFNGVTEPASADLPYVIVTQCQACLPGDQDPACRGQWKTAVEAALDHGRRVNRRSVERLALAAVP
jgi:hypothetical protein